MTALPSGPPDDNRAGDRWTRVIEGVGARVVAEGRAEMPCPAHGGEKRSGLVISIGEVTDYPAVFCRTEHCDYADVRTALVALGAPADALQPAKGGGSGQRPSADRPARRVAAPVAAPVLPTAQQVDAWHEALMRDPMLRRVARTKFRTDDEALVWADAGWDAVQDRLTLPVLNEAGEVMQVIYRDLRDDVPAGSPKSRTHKGVTGSHLYAPFGVDQDEPVVLCAGEKDVFASHSAGLNAVCVTNGEHAAPPPDRLEPLTGSTVYIAYDKDDAGRSGARRMAAAVAAVVQAVYVADLANVPGLRDKGDVFDVLQMDGGEELLRQTLNRAVAWEGPGIADAEASSWAAQDLTAVLAGDYEPQHPSIGARSDGVCLFYRGLKHAVVAESEAGKTWIALLAMVEQMQAGEHVVFIDFEDSAHGVVGRLRALGVPTDVVAARFHYVRPDEPLTAELRAVVLAAVGGLSVASQERCKWADAAFLSVG